MLVDQGARTLPSEPNELAGLVGPFWSAAHAREALGLDNEEALRTAGAVGRVLALPASDGGLLYPTWQFWRQAGVVQVKPVLSEVFEVLDGFDPWAVATLLRTPAPELGGQTPLGWPGSPEAVLSLARTVAREWAEGASPHA